MFLITKLTEDISDKTVTVQPVQFASFEDLEQVQGPQNQNLNILDEINRIKKSCGGKLLKVIIETCQLTDDEKITVKAFEGSEIEY